MVFIAYELWHLCFSQCMIYKILLSMAVLSKISKRLHTNFIQTVVIVTKKIRRVFVITKTCSHLSFNWASWNIMNYLCFQLKTYMSFVILYLHFQVIVFAYTSSYFFSVCFIGPPMKYFKIHLYFLYRFLKIGWLFPTNE